MFKKLLWAFLVIAILIEFGFSYEIRNKEINPYSSGTQNYQEGGTFSSGPLFVTIIRPGVMVIGHWLHDFHDEIVAASTVLIFIVTALLAVYTALLWGSTNDLVNKTEKTTRIHERAYLFGGGPARIMINFNPEATAVYMPDPKNVQMTIQNYGKTPAYLTKVKWGMGNLEQFPSDIPVSKIIDEVRFPIQTIEKGDVYPPSNQALPYRHITFGFSENNGKIFFGKVFYKDIFGDHHHSTFKIRIGPKIGESETLEGCYSDDSE